MIDDIVLSAQNEAHVAEICLAHGCPQAIPRYLRRGALPEMVARELAAAAPAPAPGVPAAAKAARRDLAGELEQAALHRFAAQGVRGRGR